MAKREIKRRRGGPRADQIEKIEKAMLADPNRPLKQILRKIGINPRTFYVWQRKGREDIEAGLDTHYAELVRRVEAAENRRFKERTAQAGFRGWWETGDFDFIWGDKFLYLQYCSPKTVARWEELGIAPPPDGLSFSVWPPQTEKELERAKRARIMAIRERAMVPQNLVRVGGRKVPMEEVYDKVRVVKR